MEETKDFSKALSEETVENWKANAEEYYTDLQARFVEVDERVRSVVKARPIACVAGAFAVGYIAAKMFRRWRV